MSSAAEQLREAADLLEDVSENGPEVACKDMDISLQSSLRDLAQIARKMSVIAEAAEEAGEDLVSDCEEALEDHPELSGQRVNKGQKRGSDDS